MTFECSWDAYVRTRTRGYIGLMTASTIFLVLGAHSLLADYGPRIAVLPALLAALNIGLTLVWPRLYQPLRYTVTDTEIVVERRGRNVAIPIEDIKEIKPVAYDEVFAGSTGGGTARGMFGIVGSFYGSYFAEFKAYATRKDTMVAVIMKQMVFSTHKAVILSPDDRDSFIEVVESARRS